MSQWRFLGLVYSVLVLAGQVWAVPQQAADLAVASPPSTDQPKAEEPEPSSWDPKSPPLFSVVISTDGRLTGSFLENAEESVVSAPSMASDEASHLRALVHATVRDGVFLSLLGPRGAEGWPLEAAKQLMGSVSGHWEAVSAPSLEDDPPETVRVVLRPAPWEEEEFAAFMAAVRSGDLDTVRAFLQRVDATPEQLNRTDKESITPLMAASRANQAGAVKLLLNSGAELYKSGTGLHNAYMWAADVDAVDALAALLEQGAPGQARCVGQANVFGHAIGLYRREHRSAAVRMMLEDGFGAADLIADGTPYSTGEVAMLKGNPEHRESICQPLLTDSGVMRPALTWAVLWDDHELAELLLHHGASPTQPDDEGWTPLLAASIRGRSWMLDQLLKAGADPDLAMPDRDIRIWPPVLRSYCSLSTMNPMGRLDVRDKRYRALHFAAGVANPTAVELLIQAKADVNARTAAGWTPLMLAVGGWDYAAIYPPALSDDDRLKVIELLLDARADVNAATYADGWTALDLARRAEDQVVTEILLQAHAVDDFASRPTISPLAFAKRGMWHEAQASVLNGASLTTVDEHGSTVLHVASKAGQGDLVTKILEQGADPNATDHLGASPIHYAANAQVVTALLSAGGNVSHRDHLGRTPLHYAFDSEVAQAVFRGGADVNALDESGVTPLGYAADLNRPLLQDPRPKLEPLALVQLLLASGADPNKAGPGASPTVFVACRFEANDDVVDALLAAKADPNARDKFGRTPLMVIASRSGSVPVARALLKAGASIDAQDGTGRTAIDWARLLLPKDRYAAFAGAIDDRNDPAPTPLPAARAFGGMATFTPQRILKEDSSLSVQVSLRDATVDQVLIDALNDVAMDDADHLDFAKFDADSLNLMLAIASHNDYVDLVNALLDAGANPFAPLHPGADAVVSQCTKDLQIGDPQRKSFPLLLGPVTPVELTLGIETRMDSLKAILDKSHGPLPPSSDGRTLLQQYSQEAFTPPANLLSLFLSAGEKVDEPAPRGTQAGFVGFECGGMTPLMIAAHFGHRAWVEALIDANANVNATTVAGETPLWFASAGEWGKNRMQPEIDETVRQLLRANADPNAASKDGQTPLMRASAMGGEVSVTYLLAFGASTLPTDEHRRTALMYAVGAVPALSKRALARGEETVRAISSLVGLGGNPLWNDGRPDAVETLIAHGAEVDASDDQGFTAAHYAAANHRLASLQILLGAGADPEKAALNGQTVWTLLGDTETALFKGIVGPRKEAGVAVPPEPDIR